MTWRDLPADVAELFAEAQQPREALEATVLDHKRAHRYATRDAWTAANKPRVRANQRAWCASLTDERRRHRQQMQNAWRARRRQEQP